MPDLTSLGAPAGALLKERRQNIAVAESSCGGLISAALVSIPGASDYYVGGTTWALAETGASGPTGNRYGDNYGHACFAVSGPVEKSITLETGDSNREKNMWVFAKAALDLLQECVREAA